MSRRGGNANVNQRMQSTVRRPSPRTSPSAQKPGNATSASASSSGNGSMRKPQQRVFVKKLHTQENRNTTNNHNKSSSSLIGASGMSLSDRFSKLKDQVLAQNKPSVNKKSHANQTGSSTRPSAKARAAALIEQRQQQKLKQVAQANRTKRQQVINKHRPGLKVVANNNNKLTAKQNNTKIQVKPGIVVRKNQRNSAVLAARNLIQRRGGRTGAMAGRGSGAGRGSTPKPAAKPKTGDDLDTEMDAYWFKAGKGPDPEAAKLDRQMEQYWAAKPEPGSESTTPAENSDK